MTCGGGRPANERLHGSLVVAMTVLVILSVIGTIVTLRSKDGDEIVEPLDAPEASGQRHGRRAFLLFTDWLFPILAVLIFAMTWGFSLLRS